MPYIHEEIILKWGKEIKTQEEFQKYKQHFILCYENDWRFKKIVDYLKDYDVGRFEINTSMISFKNGYGKFITDVHYPKSLKNKLKIYLAKLDYKIIDYKKRVKIKPGISSFQVYVETDSEINYLKELLDYIYEMQG